MSSDMLVRAPQTRFIAHIHTPCWSRRPDFHRKLNTHNTNEQQLSPKASELFSVSLHRPGNLLGVLLLLTVVLLPINIALFVAHRMKLYY